MIQCRQVREFEQYSPTEFRQITTKPCNPFEMYEQRSKIHQYNHAVETRALASTLYSCLPRELRNRIYTFCVEGTHDEDVIVRHSAHNKHGLIFLTRQRLAEHSYRWIEDPVIALISSHRLGEDVAREMLESYYWNRNFKLAHKEILQLEAFLKSDLLALGVVPAHYIRRLQIQIQPFRLITARIRATDRREEENYLSAIQVCSKLLTACTVVLIEVDLAEGSSDCLESYQPIDEIEHIVAKYESLAKVLKKKELRVELSCCRTWRA
ncbi:hypothetical protein FB567DRAFT_508901 [Paraphoma chrysanthemicola]|uniref:Uncharacterized protein n=1 Tax=Paraphoma chrysanthemicola TaxID=798071 RepID=A0A8K0QTI4_9PLEO|nr:hypothetical protein FB567DRAFT_508901 [Paraphoma chrysanthemicola]